MKFKMLYSDGSRLTAFSAQNSKTHSKSHIVNFCLELMRSVCHMSFRAVQICTVPKALHMFTFEGSIVNNMQLR